MAHLWACVQASLWLGSWLRGQAAADDLLAAIPASDPAVAPRVIRCGVEGDRPEALVAVLGAVRSCGATTAWLAAPRPGSPNRLLGLSSGVVLAAGELDLLRARALLVPAPTAWRFTVVDQPLADLAATALLPGPGLARLKAAMLAAREPLATTAREVAPDDLLRQLELPRRQRAAVPFPPDLGPELVGHVELSMHVLDMAGLGGRDDGAAVSATQMSTRREALAILSASVTDVLVGLVNGRNLA